MTEYNHLRPLDRITYSGAGLVVLVALLSAQQNNEIENLPKKAYSISSSSSASTNDYFSVESKSYSNLLKKLNEIGALNENWNDFGASKFSIELINRAKEFLSYIVSIAPVISVFPTARDSVQIEWEKENKYAEAEIFLDHIKIYSETNDEEIVNLSSDNLSDSASEFLNIYTG